MYGFNIDQYLYPETQKLMDRLEFSITKIPNKETSFELSKIRDFICISIISFLNGRKAKYRKFFKGFLVGISLLFIPTLLNYLFFNIYTILFLGFCSIGYILNFLKFKIYIEKHEIKELNDRVIKMFYTFLMPSKNDRRAENGRKN